MDDTSFEATETDLCVHIFTVSAAMVGVCLTVIGLFRVIAELKSVNSLGDDLLVVDACCFLGSCVLAYIAMRSRVKRRRQRLERAADWVFLSALGLMVCICGLITYMIV